MHDPGNNQPCRRSYSISPNAGMILAAAILANMFQNNAGTVRAAATSEDHIPANARMVLAAAILKIIIHVTQELS
jgi:hypothetical protein